MFTGVGLQLSATPNFPYVVIGVRGGVHLGDADIGGDIAVLVDSGNPAASILEVTSPEGIDLPRLAKLYLGPEVVATERVPPVRLKDLRLLAAPLGGTVAGRYFPPGFAIAGRAHLFGFDAQLEGSLDLTQGIVMRGAMDPIRLAPGGFEVFSFTDASGKAGPTVDVQLTLARQGVGPATDACGCSAGCVEHKRGDGPRDDHGVRVRASAQRHAADRLRAQGGA
jgi:hypothetical protein